MINSSSSTIEKCKSKRTMSVACHANRPPIIQLGPGRGVFPWDYTREYMIQIDGKDASSGLGSGQGCKQLSLSPVEFGTAYVN